MVSDDALAKLDNSELARRLEFYKNNQDNLSYVGRPAENRNGLFKKASNMNFSLVYYNKAMLSCEDLDHVYLEEDDESTKGTAQVLKGGLAPEHDWLLILDADSLIKKDFLSYVVKCAVTAKKINSKQIGYVQFGIAHAVDPAMSIFIRVACHIKDLARSTKCGLISMLGLDSPILGHNVLLNSEALAQVSGFGKFPKLPQDVQDSKICKQAYHQHQFPFSETMIAEDTDLQFRLQGAGFCGIYAEKLDDLDISQDVTYEAIHQYFFLIYKYSLASAQTMIHPIRFWIHHGIMPGTSKARSQMEQGFSKFLWFLFSLPFSQSYILCIWKYFTCTIVLLQLQEDSFPWGSGGLLFSSIIFKLLLGSLTPLQGFSQRGNRYGLGPLGIAFLGFFTFIGGAEEEIAFINFFVNLLYGASYIKTTTQSGCSPLSVYMLLVAAFNIMFLVKASKQLWQQETNSLTYFERSDLGYVILVCGGSILSCMMYFTSLVISSYKV